MPGRRTADFARLLEGDAVDLAPGTRDVSLRCGGSSARLATLKADAYPQLPSAPSSLDYSMPAGLFDRMLRHVLFAVAGDKGNAVLRGALLEIADGKANLVATDGHRLSRYSAPCSDAPQSWLLPAALLKAVSARAAQPEDTCGVAASEESIFVRLSGPQVTTDFVHVVEKGKFPDYRRVLPKGVQASVTLSAESLQNAVKRCLSLADNSGKVVRFTVSADSLKLHSADASMGENDELLPVSSGQPFPPISHLFRGEYLLDALSLLDGDVTLNFAAVGNGPGLWVMHNLQDGESFEYVLMGLKDAA